MTITPLSSSTRRYAPAYASRRAWMLKHYRDREIADYDAAIKLEPGNAMFRVARAEAWSARGMHEAAMADYAEALSPRPQQSRNLGLERPRVAQRPEGRHGNR